MTSGFEIIAEVALSHSDISKHINQVSVGWGRAETQFRGLRAKNAPRDPTLPEKVDEGSLSRYDDGKVYLNWRGDGECLAFSRVESEPNKPSKRVVRVFTRDGQIESFSEPIDGLEGVLSWRPSGNWIATVQRRNDDEAEIVFLERNGLRHGGFPLRSPGTIIRGLAWNSDSSVLAVLLQDRIQLWIMSNYEWHLKQQIVMIRTADDESYEVVWHPEKPFILFTRVAGHKANLYFAYIRCRRAIRVRTRSFKRFFNSSI
jgi:elongator complex protein 1